MKNITMPMFVLLLSLGSSHAQQNPIGGLVGGLINAAKQSAAKDEWEKVPALTQTCFNASLRKNNLSIPSLIQNGIGPNDPRLASVTTACDEMINRKFRSDYECNFNVNNRSIVTWCDEAYAIPNGNGGARRLTIDEAINASANGQQLSIGQFEKPDAERRRTQMMQKNPTATNVPKPMWNCDKASKPTDKAICNSYDLTIIDNQYGQYWNMAKPLDKKKELQKKNDGFYKAGIACNGNEDCIRRNLISAIDTIADFLKANGNQVSSYSEQEQAKKAAEEARQRNEVEQRQRLAEQQEQERQRQRADEERRLTIAKAEAEKARAEADIAKARIEADKAAAVARAEAEKAQAEAAKAKLAAEEEARKNSLSYKLSNMFGGDTTRSASPQSASSQPATSTSSNRQQTSDSQQKFDERTSKWKKITEKDAFDDKKFQVWYQATRISGGAEFVFGCGNEGRLSLYWQYALAGRSGLMDMDMGVEIRLDADTPFQEEWRVSFGRATMRPNNAKVFMERLQGKQKIAIRTMLGGDTGIFDISGINAAYEDAKRACGLT
jgi:uncharacterized protein